MPELKGYVCDGGCGATVTLDRPVDSLANHGWFTTFTPQGVPTFYTCSFICLIRVAERHATPNELER